MHHVVPVQADNVPMIATNPTVAFTPRLRAPSPSQSVDSLTPSRTSVRPLFEFRQITRDEHAEGIAERFGTHTTANNLQFPSAQTATSHVAFFLP
jgi:hypothetical protein